MGADEMIPGFQDAMEGMQVGREPILECIISSVFQTVYTRIVVFVYDALWLCSFSLLEPQAYSVVSVHTDWWFVMLERQRLTYRLSWKFLNMQDGAYGSVLRRSWILDPTR